MDAKELARHYKTIGRMVVESIERSYGKGWKSCLSVEVARALVAREAFHIMIGHVTEGTMAKDMKEHGLATYRAGLAACGLEEAE